MPANGRGGVLSSAAHEPGGGAEGVPLDAAYAAFEEDNRGSLTIGKLADMTVLSQDFTAVHDDRIGDTRVSLTIVGGRIVYRREP